MASETILILVRHGETPANIDGVWHGSIDSPLTERGQQQAERVAKHVGQTYADAAAVYTSDLQRASLTADAIGGALGHERHLKPGLREYDLGSWEGKTFSELNEVHNLWHHLKVDPDYAPHGGESPRYVAERFTTTLREIADAHTGERVIVVAHGGAFSMAMGAILHGSYTEWHPPMSNCGVSELMLDPRTELLRFNDTDHLEGL